MKIYIKIIKKFYLPLLSLAALGLIYFGVNGVKAEFNQTKETNKPQNNLADRPLNIVAVDNTQAQNVDTPTPATIPSPSLTPEVKNIPPASSTPLEAKIIMRINAGSAAGNYQVPYLENEDAYHLLTRVAAKNRFKVKATSYSFGMFVEAIGSLNNNKDNSWFFYINGKISEVGSSDYVVKPNDLIEWRYHEWWTY